MPQIEDSVASETAGELSIGDSAQGSSCATTTPRDSSSVSPDDVPATSVQVGSWKGWAELENDPVRIYHCEVSVAPRLMLAPGDF